MSKRRPPNDSIDSVLDRIDIMREELVAIEQALERIAKSKKTGKTATRQTLLSFTDAGRKTQVAGVAKLQRFRTTE